MASLGRLPEGVEPNKKQEQKVYYTNDQLLIEHIIELNSKVGRLMNKHKKLKRKYQTLCTDLYVDEQDNYSEPQSGSELAHEPESGLDIAQNKIINNSETKQNLVEIKAEIPRRMNLRYKKNSWREQVKFA